MTKLVTGLFFDIGRRDIYEDRVAVRRLRTRGNLELTVALVADGVGGANRGERAAQLAIDAALHYIENGSAARDVPRLLDEAFIAANQAVLDERDATNGASTTLTAAAVHDDRLYVANTGDSRAYLCRGRTLTQLTIDHNFATVVPWSGAMSPEAAALNPRAAVLMHYLGQRAQPHVDHGLYGGAASGDAAPSNGLSPTTDPRVAHERGVRGLPLRPGDAVLVCSDGLVKPSPAGSPYATPDEIARVLASQEGDRAARSLVSFALGRDADDNVSVGLIQLPGRRGGAGRAAALFLLLLLAAGLAAFFLWYSSAQRRELAAGPVATRATSMPAAAVAVTTENAATPAPTATEDAATPAPAIEATDLPSPSGVSAAAATATQVAFCSLADNYRYELRGVALEPDEIRHVTGNRFPAPIPIAIRWEIANTGPCPLAVSAIHRQPDDGEPPLPVVFQQEGAVLAALPPGEVAELVAELGEIATFDDLVNWRRLYQSNTIRWQPAITPAGGRDALRPVGQASLPLNSEAGAPWIAIVAPTARPTATATVTPPATATPAVTSTPEPAPPPQDEEPATPTPPTDAEAPTPVP